jgi:tRNA A-37 threonylcarbamoyl transferase component Bud32
LHIGQIPLIFIIYTTLEEEVDYWIREKNLELTEKEREEVIEEVMNRWDELADEEIEEIAEEVKRRARE